MGLIAVLPLDGRSAAVPLDPRPSLDISDSLAVAAGLVSDRVDGFAVDEAIRFRFAVMTQGSVTWNKHNRVFSKTTRHRPSLYLHESRLPKDVI